MATILRYEHKNLDKSMNSEIERSISDHLGENIILKNTPICYVDTTNRSGYMAEMYNYITKYIRINSESNNFDTDSLFAILLIASPIKEATESSRIFFE